MNNKTKGYLMMLPMIAILMSLIVYTYMNNYESFVVLIEFSIGSIVLILAGMSFVIGFDKIREKSC